MAQKPIEFKTPVKGVIKDLAFSDIKPDVALDALNVLPFDRQGRMRANQRAGTSKLYATQLGSGSQNVASLTQTTIALDPATVTADQLNFNEPFTYANGNLGTLNANWFCSNAASNSIKAVFNAASNVAAVIVASNQADKGAQRCGARYTGAITLGTAFVLKMTIRALTGTNNPNYYLAARLGGVSGSAGTNALTFTFQASTSGGPGVMSIASNDITISSNYVIPTNTAALLNTTEHIMELRANGDSFQGYIDGILYVTATTSTGSSQTQVGFGWIDAAGTVTNAPIDIFQVYTATSVATLRQTNLVACSGGNVYEGNSSGSSIAVAVGGTAILKADVIPSVAVSTGKAYIVDGFSIKQLNLLTQSMETYAATAGTAPTLCTLAAIYRGRLVLAAPRDNMQNFFFTRIGTLTDWDYSQTDSAAAFAGNASTAGRIGEPIVSLMPFSDDVLLIGGDHNLWAIRGDPTDGGSIDMVSDAIGMLGANAWTKSPDGTIYFVGTGGFFRMSPTGSAPENLSNGKWADFFRQINRGSSYVQVAWDRDREGAYIFVTPVVSGTATHIWFDSKTNSFWPIQFPNSHGPISAIIFDGDGPADRAILMGGRTGYIQKLTQTDKSDDGTAISSYLTFAPYLSSNITESILEWVDVILGEPQTGFVATDYNATVQVFAGSTVEQALSSPKLTRTKTFTAPRRQFRWLNRTRGNAFLVKVSNSTLNKTWNLETIIGMVMDGGLVRRR
jgi:hypothetical protein